MDEKEMISSKQVAIDTKIDRTEKAKKVNITYLRDKDREKVKGIFHNYETRGGSIKFPFRGYKGDPIEWYEFTDGQTYEIPLGVAKHLNKNCWVPSYEKMASDGTMRGVSGRNTGRMHVVRKVRRFGFQSLEFIPDEDLSMDGRTMSDVVGVEIR